MLKAIWHKAVRKYHSCQQEADRMHIDAIDENIAEARENYLTRVFAAPMSGYVHVQKVKLAPQEKQDYIAEREKLRAEIVARMERRREKYGLNG